MDVDVDDLVEALGVSAMELLEDLLILKLATFVGCVASWQVAIPNTLLRLVVEEVALTMEIKLDQCSEAQEAMEEEMVSKFSLGTESFV